MSPRLKLTLAGNIDQLDSSVIIWTRERCRIVVHWISALFDVSSLATDQDEIPRAEQCRPTSSTGKRSPGSKVDADEAGKDIKCDPTPDIPTSHLVFSCLDDAQSRERQPCVAARPALRPRTKPGAVGPDMGAS
ncbi:hypothetical protein K3495_g8285 [Podosphaera aphanis]|nr:hypothetical protein K3495_g8285 [Podosphaera aphanis]